jgi:hypothetical protein
MIEIILQNTTRFGAKMYIHLGEVGATKPAGELIDLVC